MKKRNHAFFFLFILGQLSLVFSQIGTFYSTDKELSNSLINAIYQDKRNYIWIATEDGLNKYDGVKFTTYKSIKGNPKTLRNNYVRTLFEDSSGRFWVGCINGLMLYNRVEDSFEQIKLFKNGANIEPSITSIIESNTHQIWVTSDQGLLIIDSNTDSYHFDSKFSKLLCSSSLVAVFQDSRRDFWILSDDQGLNRYSPSTKKLYTYKSPTQIGSNQTSAICEDHFGNIFVGTLTSGLFKFNRVTNKFEPVIYHQSQQGLPVKCLFVDKQKNLLVGTDGMGMKIYNPEKNCLEDIEIQSSLFDFSKMKVHSILQDKAGNLWTGIFQKGVYFTPNNPNKFKIYGYKSFNKNIIGSSCVMSILKDKDNIVWVCTDNDGIYGVENGRKAKHYSRTTPNSVSNTIMCIFQDSNNDIWLGSYLNGLAKFNKNNGICTYYNQISPSIGNNSLSNKVMCITEDKKKNLWIGTNGAGLYSFDLKTYTYKQHYALVGGHNGKILHDGINCVLSDRDGFIWIGTFGGVCKINPETNKIINFTTKNNILPGLIVYSMFEDHNGNIWIGTTEGLACYDKKKNQSKLYTMVDGLPSNVICGILEDEKGNIWLSTHMGISKLIIRENKFINYYAFDGLQGNEFSKGATFHASNGEMFFGGISGVSHFYPQEINDSRKKLKVYLTDLYIMDVPLNKERQYGAKNQKIITRFISDADTIHLSYKDNMFSLEFSTFDFGNSERVYYRYKMEGLNSEWVNTEQGVSRINFTNISYGTYKLKVMACIQNNMSPEKEYLIIITPPWYLSWWAKTIYFILVVLLGYGITRYILIQIEHKQEMMKREHAEQINEAKLQFFINISHEIRTPMTLIISPLEKLISENSDIEKQKVYKMMYRNGQRILRLINQLLDIRKIDKGLMFVKMRETDIVGFMDDLMQTFDYQANKRNIYFEFIHAEPKLNVWIDLNNFDKVLLNILSNAFKYTPENGEIIVSLRTGVDENVEGPLRSYFEIIISDTGIGIEEEMIERIFERFYQIDNDQTKSNFGTGIGLHLARSLVELQHGIILARNKIDGQGSEFVVRLPMGHSHLNDLEIENYSAEPSQKTALYTPDAVLYDEMTVENEPKIKSKTKYRILVVDDEDEIRQYIRTELSDMYMISECRNGKEALDFILKEKPHLVISDVMMPEMDGITLCKRIKSNINVNHIPIILLTAKSADEDKAEGFDIGADAYVVKPFNIALLKKRIAGLLGNRKRLEMKLSDADENKLHIKTVVMRSSDQVLLEKILKIINDNIADPDLNVEFLASGVGMSRVHMHRKLKELTNQSARDFIKSIRLKQAAELLSTQKTGISELAYALGFSNLSHFSNSFREFYGMSPKEYAQHVNENKKSD
ncbi:MAG: two-component regulator propeller domain-containing protein [Paludibacter sp.]|nr:two-component regulator propeller domain-containing protein [Paludibacter sp.]